MPNVRYTDAFASWIEALPDIRAKAKIAGRIDRLARGNPGDVKPVGQGVSEMRVHYGPGYRVYFVQRGQTLVIILCGGDKKSQSKDIKIARALAAALRENSHGQENNR